MAMTISEAGQKSGCTPPTIRYYESIGLVPQTDRTTSGRRSYTGPDVARLAFIRRARDFGLGIPQVRELLAAAELPTNVCAAGRPIVEEHLGDIRAKRAELKALEVALLAILRRCDDACQTTETDACGFFSEFRLPAKTVT
ncbi:MAG: MerR family transcriptional regulator [Deltaproteobacteria bacterium]